MAFTDTGPKLVCLTLKQKHVEQLRFMVQVVQGFGVRVVPRQMAMDVMGLKREDLIDGVEVGGVGLFLNSSYQSNTTLFVERIARKLNCMKTKKAGYYPPFLLKKNGGTNAPPF